MPTTASIGSGISVLLRGAGVTLALVASSVALGTLLGTPIGIGHRFAPRPVRFALVLFDRVFRGFPAIVLLFLAYFGIGSLPGISISPFLAVVVALGLRSAAYQGQILRGSLEMIDRGQIEAARAVGLSIPKTVIYVLLPQAACFSLPALANEYSIVLKDTALAFTVGVVDLMSRAKFLAMQTREALGVYLIVAAVYFVLTHAGVAFFHVVEKRTAIPGLGSSITRRRR